MHVKKGSKISFPAGARIDRDKCVPWVGSILLESETQRTEGIPKAAFIQTWKDQLPEAWRDQAQLELLEVCCSFRRDLATKH